jgi:hypothetical protein
VAADVVGVGELIGDVIPGLAAEAVAHLHRFLEASLLRHQPDLGTEILHHAAPLDRHVLRHEDHHPVPHLVADHGEGDAGVARRRFDDRVSLLQIAAPLRLLQHEIGDAILDAAARIGAFELDEDIVDLHQGGVADRLERRHGLGRRRWHVV